MNSDNLVGITLGNRYDMLEKINGLMKYNGEILQNDVTFSID